MFRAPTLGAALRQQGISRREFLSFCGAMAAILSLPAGFAKVIAQALSETRLPTLVWLEFQDCAGNSESMLRSSHPDVANVVLELLSWEYHELIMAGAGQAAEELLERIVAEQEGRYLAVVEGSIPLADGGVYCTIAGRTAVDIARHVCSHAAATLAIGACAWDGGLVAADPNPTGAVGVQEAVPGIRVVNLGGCPHNPANTAALLVHYLTFGEMPALDEYNRPLFAYGRIIHDQCERRSHYDAGRYVETWGDEGARKGWCLYKMGCKGPQATFNCPTVRWNYQTSWPVKSGHNCLACASYRFWDTMSPFYRRLPQVAGFGVDTTAGEIGIALTAIVGAGTVAHAIASAVRHKIRPTETTAPGPTAVPPEPPHSPPKEDDHA
ncbi:MAG: [Ni/Fe] hydrogenase small subunit [Candidatus Zixiibacteriota bacterium]|nr:MAG: [Ni/Fe] hydrogenase small subunit [candidate division Zixibacteria bacterium]